MKNICLLGATGSIGTQTLDIIFENKEQYSLKTFSFGHNIDKAKEIIEKFKPELVVTPFFKEFTTIKKYIKTNKLNVKTSMDLLSVVMYQCSNQMVINALVGSVGLPATIKAIKNNKILLLANKESLVMAGRLVNEELRKSGSQIIPIDSEHSALYQLISSVNYHDIRKLYITASGGALRDYPIERLTSVTVQDALKHPNWKMGSKITIDSATMMNKVFELVEAKYLFGIDNVEALIDRTSTVHAAVELEDGRVLYHTSPNDMHLPIKYAMEFPNLNTYNQTTEKVQNIEVLKIKMNLQDLDSYRYPLIKYGKLIIEDDLFLGTIVNSCNEVLVDKFLHNEILYTDIERIMDKVVETNKTRFNHLKYNLKNIQKVNKIIIKEVEKCFGKLS